MISADEDLAQFARAVGDLVGAGSVSDDVAQVHDQVVGRSSGEACVEGLEIGMDVAQQQYAHGSPDKLPIIDRMGAFAGAGSTKLVPSR